MVEQRYEQLLQTCKRDLDIMFFILFMGILAVVGAIVGAVCAQH
jgi:hypothetical protein